jgi:hypothetical protein
MEVLSTHTQRNSQGPCHSAYHGWQLSRGQRRGHQNTTQTSTTDSQPPAQQTINFKHTFPGSNTHTSASSAAPSPLQCQKQNGTKDEMRWYSQCDHSQINNNDPTFDKQLTQVDTYIPTLSTSSRCSTIKEPFL